MCQFLSYIILLACLFGIHNDYFVFPLWLRSTRVSNELGAGNPWAAKLAIQVVLFMAVVEGMLVASALVAVRGVWGYIYTNEEEVVRYVATVLPVLALSNFMDGMQGVLSG